MLALGVLAGMPLTARAVQAGAFTINTAGGWVYSAGTLTIITNGNYTIGMATPGATTTTDRIVVKLGAMANITLSGVSIDVSGISGACAFDMTGALVNISLSGSNTIAQTSTTREPGALRRCRYSARCMP